MRRFFVDEDDLFVSKRVGGVAHRSVDVVTGQPWIRFEQILFRDTLAQFAEKQFDGDTSSADHGLPEYHAPD